MVIDWPSVRLVAFDVDGTLYDQKPMRLRMATALVWDGLRRMDPISIRVLKAYRSWREDFADDEVEDFEPALIAKVAQRFGLTAARVNDIVDEWINRRPLALLGPCRFAGVKEVFEDLRASGRLIGVLSDYPAQAKLEAMGLQADIVVSAADDGIAMMKPNPRGLQKLMALAGVEPHQTIFIGDRAERDGEAGRRAGVRTYLRSTKAIPGAVCFSSYASLRESGLSERALPAA